MKLLLVVFLLFSSSSYAGVSTDPLTFHYDEYSKSLHSDKIAVINWHSKDGIKRFESSKYKDDFFRLAHHFKYQHQPSTCGIASAVTVISAIYEAKKEKMPLASVWPITFNGKTYGLEYRIVDENNNFFNDATDKILDRRAIVMRYPHNINTGEFMGGIDMEELVKMIQAHKIKANITYVTKDTPDELDKFRIILKNTLQSPKSFMIGNYNRSYAGIEMGGHYSPIVAYDEQSDSVLIMDIATHKNPWIWVDLEDLYKSMHSKNYAKTNYRGYIIIKV